MSLRRPVLALLLALACTRGSGAPATNTASTVSTVAAVAASDAAGPELVQPGVISTDRNETFPAIDPRDGSLWFSVYDKDFNRQTVMRAAAGEGESDWQEPRPVAFSGRWGDRAPRFSPDGSQLWFSSNRPLAGKDTITDYNLWLVQRGPDGAWSAPAVAPSPVRMPGSKDMHASVTRDGVLYFSSDRFGTDDIVRVRLADGPAARAERVPLVDDSLPQTDVLVSPDGTWMIDVVTDAPGGLGGDDLYLSRFVNGAWTAPRNLGAPINSHTYEYGPSLSPDGRWLYFTSHRRGTADIFRIPVSRLGLS